MTARMGAATRSARVVGRLAVSSATATAADALVYQIALGGVAAPTAADAAACGALAALFGAAVAFTLNRHWVFEAAKGPLRTQAALYAVSWVLNIAVLSVLLWVFIALGVSAAWAYMPAKLITWASVSYYFQQRVVFARAP